MNRKSSIRAILLRKECLLFFLLLLPMFTKAQYNKVYADITANMLVDMGFENVVWSEDEKERVYVLENTPWRLQGVGLAHAIDRIQKTGLPEKGKSCRIVVLDNNIPQISLIYTANPDSLKAAPGSYAARSAWDATYDLGDSWDKVKKEYRMNSSLFKVDVVVYPELYLKNLIITQIYQVLFNLSPADRGLFLEWDEAVRRRWCFLYIMMDMESGWIRFTREQSLFLNHSAYRCVRLRE